MLDRAELLDRPDIAAWIVEAGLADVPVPDLVAGAVERLRAARVPLDRVNIAFRVLHPLFDGMSVIWTVEEGIAAPEFTQIDSEGGAAEFIHSPFFHMLSNRLAEYRLRLGRDEEALRYPVVTRLQNEAHTDYFAAIVGFGANELHPESHDGIATSWSTRDPGGFTDSDLAEVRRTLRPLGLAMRLAIKEQLMRTALDTFHGPMVGARILSGAIRRGAGTRIRAALWYSDLRDSTGLAEALPTEEFLALLNIYFECAAGAVTEAGGEVLDIVGDATLAFFPAEDGESEREACAAALAAARAAHERLDAMRGEDAALGTVSLPGSSRQSMATDCSAQAEASRIMDARNESGHDSLGGANIDAHAVRATNKIQFGVGVHFGEVVFGNAGAPDRLKFSCHGRAVNETARMAELAKRLGRQAIVSEAAVSRLGHALEDLGYHALRGFPVQRRLWA